MRKTWAVIRREFLERVRTRWFVISTILGPLFMMATFILPLVLAGSEGRERSLAVIDATTDGFGGRVTENLDRSQPLRATRVPAAVTDIEHVADSLGARVALKVLDGYLVLTDAALADGQVEYRGVNVASPRDMQTLSRYLDESALTERLTRVGVDPRAVREARIEMRVKTTKLTGIAGTRESGEGALVLAFVIWFSLYISIIMYGVSVMGSVVEEKTSRVVEILLSSLRPFHLLAGKIVGVGAVGLFQLLIWGVCGVTLIENQARIRAALGIAVTAGTLNLPHVPMLTGAVFLTYFLLGFFLYAAMFAAVAAMSSSEAEARQAQTPVVMLLIVPTMLMVGVMNDPGGSLATAMALIPFFSPIVMPVRWAASPVPLGELALSLLLLVVAVVVVTWIASRIFRVGVLMYGKRPTVRELLRWVRTP